MATTKNNSNTKKKGQPAKKRLPSSSSTQKTRSSKTYTINLTSRTQITITKRSPSRPAGSTKNSKDPYDKIHNALHKERSLKFAHILVVIGAFGLLYFSTSLFSGRKIEAEPIQSQTKVEVRKKPPQYMAKSNAQKIEIASIGVNASVGLVGQYRDGTLEVPKDPAITAQYSKGPTPGEIGPSIIVGHVDSLTGPAVFWRLRELKIDDQINITREDGSVAKFRVESIESFSQDAFPTNKVYGNINHAGLRLITCSGQFNPLKNRYSHNTVVFASLII